MNNLFSKILSGIIRIFQNDPALAKFLVMKLLSRKTQIESLQLWKNVVLGDRGEASRER